MASISSSSREEQEKDQERIEILLANPELVRETTGIGNPRYCMAPAFLFLFFRECISPLVLMASIGESGQFKILKIYIRMNTQHKHTNADRDTYYNNKIQYGWCCRYYSYFLDCVQTVPNDHSSDIHLDYLNDMNIWADWITCIGCWGKLRLIFTNTDWFKQ